MLRTSNHFHAEWNCFNAFLFLVAMCLRVHKGLRDKHSVGLCMFPFSVLCLRRTAILTAGVIFCVHSTILSFHILVQYTYTESTPSGSSRLMPPVSLHFLLAEGLLTRQAEHGHSEGRMRLDSLLRNECFFHSRAAGRYRKGWRGNS